MALDNEDKAMLERMWIGVARRMDDEFQRVLESLRGMCEGLNSFESRHPLPAGTTYTMILMRLGAWRTHFTKYLEVASAHPLEGSESYVETLRRIVGEIEAAMQNINAKRGDNVWHLQGNASAPPASQQPARPPAAPRAPARPTPPAQPAPPEEDPLRAIQEVRRKEAEDIQRSQQEMMKLQKETMERMAQSRREHSEKLQELRNKRWRR